VSRWRAVWILAFLLFPATTAADDAPALQLVETFPIETDLDTPELPEAHDVWLEMIGAARTSLDFAEFYASNEPGSRLETIVQAVEAAADRGVQVRFLADERFYKTYPETLERLDARDNIEMRRYDMSKTAGGVLHAKYFIVDAREAFIGSQNFDWRALTHIQELGVRIRHAEIVRPFVDVFNLDWGLAGGTPRRESTPRVATTGKYPLDVQHAGGTVRVTPVASPTGWLPDSTLWDLPRLVSLIDSAQKSVRVQLLSYRTLGRDKEFFAVLDNAFRRAAARGVEVQLLLADWSKRGGTIEDLKSLQVLPNIDVKLVTIPQWSGGFIPFARVVHAKYLVVDGARSWVGTSNWEKSYFHTSRNVGVIVEGEPFAAQLDRFFLRNWNHAYATAVDPGAEYPPPRIGE
jgi:phosphatidylserine/phosphatidylglycerophosphate/cardiolipin synthase-like enzyme